MPSKQGILQTSSPCFVSEAENFRAQLPLDRGPRHRGCIYRVYSGVQRDEQEFPTSLYTRAPRNPCWRQPTFLSTAVALRVHERTQHVRKTVKLTAFEKEACIWFSRKPTIYQVSRCPVSLPTGPVRWGPFHGGPHAGVSGQGTRAPESRLPCLCGLGV